MNSEVAIVKILGRGELAPPGYSTIRLSNQTYERLITYTTVAEFNRLTWDRRRLILEELINLFSSDAAILA